MKAINIDENRSGNNGSQKFGSEIIHDRIKLKLGLLKLSINSIYLFLISIKRSVNLKIVSSWK